MIRPGRLLQNLNIVWVRLDGSRNDGFLGCVPTPGESGQKSETMKELIGLAWGDSLAPEV